MGTHKKTQVRDRGVSEMGLSGILFRNAAQVFQLMMSKTHGQLYRMI